MDNRLVFLTALLVTLSWMSVGTYAQKPTSAATAAPPITANTTVTALVTAIDRTDCGTGQLCAAQPSNCDPSTSSSCFFLAAKQKSGRNFDFELSGESNGYLAATLSLDSELGGNDTTYVCANNGGVVKFFGALLNNDKLTVKVLSAGSVKGKIDGNKIQCTFSATVPPPTTKTKIFALGISTGTYNSTDGALGSPTVQLKSLPLSLENPNTPVTVVIPTQPITPNTTVTALMTAINRSDCGTGPLCAAQPSNCDPSTSSSCFFLAAKQSSGRNFDFELSGESDGYIAATLSLDSELGGNDTTYVCANNGGVVQFFSALLNNDKLTVKELSAGSVKGKIDGNKIQCTFSATVPPPTSRTKIFTLGISTGTYNSTDDALGSPTVQLKSLPLNLAIPNITVTNVAPPPPITPNTTVTALMTAINRSDCGTGQLCAGQPSDCDPSTNSSCFFLAAKQSSGRNFDFELSGESDGYIAATLSLDSELGGNDTTYVCANNGGVVQFFGALLNNDKLTVKVLEVGSVKGNIDGNKIQCTFSATVPPPTTRTKIFTLGISTGTYNSTDDALGSPTVQLKSLPLNLAIPNITVTNVAPPPPITPDTTVTALMTAINRSDCGTGQLCAGQPSDCDPSTNSSCFFLAAKQSSGRNFDFELSGESDGYIAATLSLDSELGGNDTTYVCANNGGVVKFFGALLNNDKLTVKVLSAGSVKGKIDGNKIQCTFSATVPPPTTRTKIFTLGISTGTYNSTDDALGSPTVQLKSLPLNLAIPNITVTNVAPPPPITPDTTVTALMTAIDRTDCGTGQLCAAQPSNCDPSTSSSCFFLAAKQSRGRNFDFELSGESDGYLAATLSLDSELGGNDETYVCANNGGVVKFFGTLLNNDKLTVKVLEVGSVKGKIDGNKIQCTFSATVPPPTTRTKQFALGISTGTYNSTDDALGSPTVQLKSLPLNLAIPNITVTNVAPPPPITPNTTVTALMTAINRSDCGTGQLCAGQPSDCDPSTNSSCFFLAAKQSSGRNFDFELSGESDGYIAATLSLDSELGGNDETYVCANNGGVVQFFGALLNNDKLTVKVLEVGSVKGKIDGNKIQCTFSATVPPPTTRTKIFTLGISTGTYNSTDDALGSPTVQLKSLPLNLAIPNITVTNVAPPPPITPDTTVTALMTAIDRTDCGTGQLCAAQPSNCDPSTSSSCFFLAAKQSRGRNFDFELSGESDGYLAATLSLDSELGGNDETYVCANNGGVVKFFGTLLNNDKLTVKVLEVGSVKGKIDGNKIQCTFSATVPPPTTRTKIFTLGISTGTYNSTDDALGSPTVQLKSLPLNLAIPNITVTNVAPTPPITPNTTVTALMTAINRSDCGTGQLCAAQPSNCDPSTSSSCFFLAAKQSSGRNFDFELSGESNGYLAATLSLDSELGGNDTTYVCANNGGVVKFFGALLNNDKLTVKVLSVGSVKGKIDGNKIQCTFSATVPPPTTRTKIFALGISTGTYNSTDDALGSPTVQLKSLPLNLANPNTPVTVVVPTQPITPNTTVTALVTAINRTDCGTGQLCAAQPSNCDPSTNSSCFFLAAKRSSGRNFDFELSGESNGYIAATLSLDSELGGNDTTYVCANNGSVVQFFGALLNKNKLTVKVLEVGSVKGKIDGNKIQCTFSATVPPPTTTTTFFALAISNGTYNRADGTLGLPIFQFQSSLVNLSNPNIIVINVLPTTTSHAITIQQSLTQALLITVGVLVLTVL